MFAYPMDCDYIYDQSPYYNNNRRRRYYNPQLCTFSYPNSQPFSSFHNPPRRYYPNPYHLHESYYDPDNIVNLVSGLNQNHNEHHNEYHNGYHNGFHNRFHNRFNNGYQNERHHNERHNNERYSEEKNQEKERRKNGYRKVKIFGPEDEPVENNHKNNNAFTKQQAAKKIYTFLKHKPATRRTQKILVRLLHLRNLQNQLNTLSSQNSNFGTLTFTSKDSGKQLLPNTKENKLFLVQEDAILRILDQLDKVQSEGNEIIRERRKEIVKIAQKMLEELDAEKERQWKLFCDRRENIENFENFDNDKEDLVIENIKVDKKDTVIEEVTDEDIVENIKVDKKDVAIEEVTDEDVSEKMEDDKEKDIVNEEVTDELINSSNEEVIDEVTNTSNEEVIDEVINTSNEEVIDEVVNTSNNASETEEIKPYTISSPGDDEKDFDFIDIISDFNSSIKFSDEETVNAREPLMVVVENAKENNEAALNEIKQSQNDEQIIPSPMEDVEDINKENNDTFVIVNNISN
ncbi:30065_t:CDS:1 [Gigaspora margarita]|uniref:30065_t:CDS:1 n=1 Tax=Gigaspora margarita TaxID=4874 RepID=A0ABM8W423_GIGMA|nr:30065_t:CDS:1 [Gigaspora margarita]